MLFSEEVGKKNVMLGVRSWRSREKECCARYVLAANPGKITLSKEHVCEEVGKMNVHIIATNWRAFRAVFKGC